MNFKTKRKAFTLAEVLITLIVIGVIAAFTIPNLMQNIQDAQLNTALKKVYSDLSAAHKKVVSDNGGTYKGIKALYASYDHTGLATLYASHLNHIKFCDSDARAEGCWHPYSTDGGTWKTFDGNATATNSYNIYGGVILSNGALVNFISQSLDCAGSYYYNKNAVCALMIADVNGFKEPNRTGKDIFYFYVLENSITPFGEPNCVNHYCSGSGLFCAVFKLMQ